jgi:hypothetical protein
MKKVFLSILVIGIISCGGEKKVKPNISQDKIAAVYKYRGNINQGWLYRVIFVDSAIYKKLGKEFVDTAWYLSQIIPLTDSLKKPLLDSNGRQMIREIGIPIPKDSVIFNIENKPLDSLIKKFQK